MPDQDTFLFEGKSYLSDCNCSKCYSVKLDYAMQILEQSEIEKYKPIA